LKGDRLAYRSPHHRNSGGDVTAFVRPRDLDTDGQIFSRPTSSTPVPAAINAGISVSRVGGRRNQDHEAPRHGRRVRLALAQYRELAASRSSRATSMKRRGSSLDEAAW